MAPPSAAQLYARALWDPKPAKTPLSQQTLAYALGYPSDWRVERTVEKTKDGAVVISDRIHYKAKNKSHYTWFHHDAAHRAAAEFERDGTLNASHLLPPLPRYAKGDLVQVRYEGKWYAGTILKRRKKADEFLYTVHYTEDDSTQSDVEEVDIKPGEDPSMLAAELGFPNDWKAARKGARFVFTAPTGERFTTKKAALKFLKEQCQTQPAAEEDEGDPPWRTEGHEFLGRRISYTSTHKVSGTRRIKVEQEGTIVGYIDEKDLDSQGNPGFISESSGKPANLFHVVFKDDPHHPYAQHLLTSQDLEEFEVLECLLEETPKSKRGK